MNPESQAVADAWLDRAAMDLRAAAADLAARPPIVEDALFHCQQAVEKTLKAFLTARGRTFAKTHDLDVLARACESLEPRLVDVLRGARDLTTFAWVFRYPGEWERPRAAKARQPLVLAQRVYDKVAAMITAGGRDS